MSASDCPKSKPSKAAATLEMLDLALLNAPDVANRDISEGMLAFQSCVTGGSDPVLSGGFVSRDRCWLCQCPRTPSNCNSNNSLEESCKSKVGVLSEFLPWLCPDCEKTMEEEEKRVELTHLSSLVSLDTSDPEDSVCNDDNVCQCNSCTEVRQAEAEHEKETKELQDFWMELSRNVRQVYYRHKEDDVIDVEKMNHFVTRLVTHDAHQLYQRLESQGREVVIEMKVKLLKVLTFDYKTAAGAYQFVSMLLEEYAKLCQSCQTVAEFLQPLVNDHLRQFCLTWQLHNKHLFHCIIFTDPVVQNCLPKAVENLRQGLSKSPNDCQVSYSQTLAEYEKFVNEMSVISTTWKHCQRLIEKYDEKQAALKVKQKMFKEDWEFFKAQRRLLEQMVPKSKSSAISCHRFEMQFQQMQKILHSNREQEYECPNCRQVQCSLDENSISHLITCGIISPEVVQESSNMESFHNDLSAYLNIKPPSMPSSGSSSGSGSPIILDREQFIVPYGSGSDEEMAEEPVSDDEDYHDAELAPPDCGSGQSLASDRQTETDSALRSDLFTLATDADDIDGLEKIEFKETKPSSSVAKLAFAQVRSDGDSCSCHHCKLENNTLCMFSRARIQNPNLRRNTGILLSNLFSPEICDSPVRVEDIDDAKKAKEHETLRLDMSQIKLIQNSSTSLSSNSHSSTPNKTILGDTMHCLGVHSLTKSLCQESSPPLHRDSSTNFCGESVQSSGEGSKELLHLENWKMDAFTDHWNSSRLRKNFLLKIPEMQSVDNGISEESKDSQKTDVTTAVSKPVALSSVAKCLAVSSSSVSCQQQSAAFQSTSSNAKPPSGPNASLGSSCQISADKKMVHTGRTNSGSNDAVKSSCAKSNQQKQGTSTAGTQCRGADSNGGCLLHSCERQGEESAESKEESCDQSATSQKEGKHCECWHCEFFGRETPSSIPLSKNYPEMRERLRQQLKKKKEKERMSQKINSDSPQKPGGGNFSSTLYDMEEVIRFINGSCEANENVKESRSGSRAASKKSKRQKKLKDNMTDFDVASNMRCSSETSSSLGSLADSGFSSRERMNSKHALEHDRLSGDVEQLGFRLTTSLESVSSNGRNEVSSDVKTNGSVISDKSVPNVEKKGAAKIVRAQSAALTRSQQAVLDSFSSEELDILSMSASPRSAQALKTNEMLSKRLAALKNLCVEDCGMKKYSKDSKSAFNSNLSLSCKSNGKPKSVPENAKQKLSPNPAPPVSDCTNRKAGAENPTKSTSILLTMSPTTKAKHQKRRSRSDDVVLDDVFLPKDNFEAEDYDGVVEEFKRFCFSTPPLQKRKKLPITLNLKDIFNRRKWSQGCTS